MDQTKAKRAKYLGIAIARCIVQGDVHLARTLAAIHPLGWHVAEARALYGAVRAANARFGTTLTANEFMRAWREEK